MNQPHQPQIQTYDLKNSKVVKDNFEKIKLLGKGGYGKV